MISEDNLPLFVRVLALNSNLMSQIYLDTGEAMQPYTSSECFSSSVRLPTLYADTCSSDWVSRLHHLTRFRAQLEAKRAQSAKSKEENGGSQALMDPHEAITKLY